MQDANDASYILGTFAKLRKATIGSATYNSFARLFVHVEQLRPQGGLFKKNYI
jgi:hypothetical protein